MTSTEAQSTSSVTELFIVDAEPHHIVGIMRIYAHYVLRLADFGK